MNFTLSRMSLAVDAYSKAPAGKQLKHGPVSLFKCRFALELPALYLRPVSDAHADGPASFLLKLNRTGAILHRHAGAGVGDFNLPLPAINMHTHRLFTQQMQRRLPRRRRTHCTRTEQTRCRQHH
ncbi:MAG: hypothetical protein HPKKFMNG_00486 [Planctomycetes bacterium]|nr:hypothetical protein [Planctomycetota bacterium]